MKRFRFLLCALSVCCVVNAQITLEECRQLACENYPLIKQYGLIALSTDFTVANIAKTYLPQVSFGAQARYQSDVPAFSEQITQAFSQMGIDMKSMHKDQYKVALDVSQIVWDGGLTKAQKEISRAEGDVSIQSVETEMYKIRERVNQLYFGILMLREQTAQNALLRELLQSNYENVASLVKNGVALDSDLSMIKAEQLAASQQLTQIESMITACCQMLSAMTGKQIAEDETFIKPNIETFNVPTNENDRPELRLFDAQSLQFEARKKAITASTLPRVGLFAQGYYGYPGLNMFEDMMNDKWSWNYIAGINLQWNFDSFYTKKGHLRKLQIAQQQVNTQRDVFLFNSNLQQLQQTNDIRKMNRLMADDEKIIQLRTEIRQSSEAKYANGTLTIHELLRDIIAENQSSLTKAIHEIEYLKSIYELKNTINK